MPVKGISSYQKLKQKLEVCESRQSVLEKRVNRLREARNKRRTAHRDLKKEFAAFKASIVEKPKKTVKPKAKKVPYTAAELDKMEKANKMRQAKRMEDLFDKYEKISKLEGQYHDEIFKQVSVQPATKPKKRITPTLITP